MNKLLEALTLAEEVLTAARNAVDFGSVYDSCGNALAAIREQKAELEKQEPVAYLCDGSRYKVLGEDRSGYGRILGLPESLAGQWVALVDATDGKHLRAAPVRTKDLTEKWIDPNDKSQKQYLPHIGEKVLFCCDGEVYYGHHTGGAFQKGHGVTKSLFPTWDCMWMHLPAAVIAADR